MNGNLAGFNANEHDPNTGYDLLPGGKYVCAITASEMKPTKNMQGKYLELELTVLDGPYKNRKLWDRIMLVHQSDDAVRIGQGTLSAICRAVGVLTPRDSSELHMRPMLLSVGQTRRTDIDDYQNVIRSYAAVNAAPPLTLTTTPRPANAHAAPAAPAAPAESAPTSAASPASSNEAPWKRDAPAPAAEPTADADAAPADDEDIPL